MLGLVKKQKEKLNVLNDFLELARQSHCVVCAKKPCDPDHIKTRGSGGGDSWDNIIPLCRRHHTERHAKGMKYMSDKYKGYHEALASRGWSFVDEFGVYRLRKSTDKIG
jgi:hypothetical protein